MLALLLYPGLLYGLLLAVISEWLASVLRPAFTPRALRTQTRPASFLQPLRDVVKLAGRHSPARWLRPGVVREVETYVHTLLAFGCVFAPVLALTLLPLPGNPIAGESGQGTDLFTALALLAAQPVLRAVLRLRVGGVGSLRGAQDLGRLLIGLVPALFAVAALAEVSESGSLQIASLSAAPETPAQFFVRLFAGIALLTTLPWWLDWRESGPQKSAGTYAGDQLQRSALASFWSVMSLPAPGVGVWAAVVYLAGAAFAYVAIHILSERWAAARREKDAANLAWATALPVAALAFVIAIWGRV